MQWAGRLRPSVALVAREIFADRAVDGMRPVRALIRLADTYTTGRLEAACRRAMHFATPSYQSVKNILVHELDRLPQQQPAEPEDGQIQFLNATDRPMGRAGFEDVLDKHVRTAATACPLLTGRSTSPH